MEQSLIFLFMLFLNDYDFEQKKSGLIHVGWSYYIKGRKKKKEEMFVQK